MILLAVTLALPLLLAPRIGLADATGDAYATYAGLPAPKALAIAADPERSATGWASGAPGDAAAAIRALEACEARRQTLAVDAACEVVHLNANAIETGAALRARASATRHPLFLWRYTSPSAIVYLAGSMHVMKPTLLPLPAPIERAFARSDRLAVEVNPLAIAHDRLQETLARHAYLPAGQTLDALLPAAVMTRLREHLASQRIPFETIARLKPALVATQLAVGRLTALGYLRKFGIDQQLIERAGARPVLELERFEDQIELLASPPFELQSDMLAVTLAQMDDIDELLADLVVAWLSGDERALRRLFDEQSPQTEAYRVFDHQLLDARNAAMADRVQEFLAMRGTCFVVVGAAHLAGEDSIVRVLTTRGVAGRRIYSDDEV